MTLTEAIRDSLPTEERTEHLPIRRSSWLHGISIVWRRDTWQVMNGTTTGLNARNMIDLLDGGRQGCLTPESMLSDDWSVVE